MLIHIPSSPSDFYEIMDMLDKRLNDKGKNWRHVLKSLKVLDYCLHEGSELVVTWARKNIYIIKTLREFQYVDEEGRDVGQNGRLALRSLKRKTADSSQSAYLRKSSLLSFSTKTACAASAQTANCGRLALPV
jgi:hypothetical protein